MPRKHSLSTAHMKPLEITHHPVVLNPGQSGLVDGCKVHFFGTYTAPLQAPLPRATSDGLPLPETLTQEAALLRHIGEVCRPDDPEARRREEVEEWLVTVLESQCLQVASETRVFSVALFNLEDVLVSVVKRKLMLFPSVVSRVTREIEDQLTYVLSVFRARGQSAREFVFNAGRHLLWSPGDLPLDAGLRLRATLRKFQNDVGRVLRDPQIMGATGKEDFTALLRKTEGCFFVEDDGSVWVHLHAHCVVSVLCFLKKDEWRKRLERLRKSMEGRGWVGYVHVEKLSRAGARYILKAPQKLTEEDFGREKRNPTESPLLDLPPQAIAAWAVAGYYTHLIEAYGTLAALRTTLKGDPQHNVPARAIVRLKQRSRQSEPSFVLRWKSDEPKMANPETGRFGDDYHGKREGRYLDCKIKLPPRSKELGETSASRLFKRPEGLLCPGAGGMVADVRLITVTRPARSTSGKRQPRMIIATEWSDLPRHSKLFQRRRALELLHARILDYRGWEHLYNPAEKKKAIRDFWRNLCARFYGLPHRLLHSDHNAVSSPEAVAAGEKISTETPTESPP